MLTSVDVDEHVHSAHQKQQHSRRKLQVHPCSMALGHQCTELALKVTKASHAVVSTIQVGASASGISVLGNAWA